MKYELYEVHDTKEKAWLRLDFFHLETFLHARVPRIKRIEHGVKLVNVPGTRQNSGFTFLFEN
jgi:transposase